MRFDLDMPIKAIVSRERVGFGGASVDEVERVGGMVPLCDERPVIFDMVQPHGRALQCAGYGWTRMLRQLLTEQAIDNGVAFLARSVSGTPGNPTTPPACARVARARWKNLRMEPTSWSKILPRRQ
jgi:hypothetical protein